MIRYVVPITMEEAQEMNLLAFIIMMSVAAVVLLVCLARKGWTEWRKFVVPTLAITEGMQFENRYRHRVWVKYVEDDGSIVSVICIQGMFPREQWWKSADAFKEHLTDRGFYLYKRGRGNK